MWKLALLFFLLLQINRTKAISDAWYGSYSLHIDYGKLDDLSGMSIGYDITITRDSITFFGMGYKTYFTDLCEAVESGDTLVLKVTAQIDDEGFNKHEVNSVVARLYKRQQQYYLKSPVVADKNWNYDTTMLIFKQ